MCMHLYVHVVSLYVYVCVTLSVFVSMAASVSCESTSACWFPVRNRHTRAAPQREAESAKEAAHMACNSLRSDSDSHASSTT